MHEDTIDDLQSRLLFLVGYPRDAKLTQDVLDATGIAVAACPDMDSLATEVERGASAVILPEERLAQIHGTRFFDWLQHQPPWSDLPILIVAHSGDSSVAINQAMEFLGNTTILERPMRITSLVSAVRTALRARQKQYQVRDLLKNLHEADNKKDEFLAVLSHELRNPLAPIRSALEILKLDDSLTPSSRELTGLMERQVNHMVRLVDDLLEISRLTRGKIDLRLETVDMVSVLMSAVETSKPIIESRGHTLDLSIQAGRHYVKADPVRLAQVFSNLFNNAAKYTDSQGQISCTVVEHEGTVEITVKDSGCGIPSDMLTEVFELFTQIDRNRARSDAGLGIGLTLVKRLVELQGGTVEAQSDGPGKGSRFVVRLPRISSGARPAFLEGQGTKNQIGKRVLVVDDNQDAANTMGAFLRMRGAEVQVAFDGEAALAAADEMHPQVVLLDLSMPGKSGYDVAGLIRQTPWGADALVIAISGHSQPEDRRHTQTSGFDHHLAKPADLTLLDRIIREG